MKKNLKLFIIYYLPAILWAGMIFYFSSISDLRLGTGVVSEEIISRKLAHLLEYAFLFWLVFRIFYYGHKKEFKKSVLSALAVSILYAASDELHQTFTPGRAGKIIDVIFDATSAFLGLQLLVFFVKRKFTLLRILLVFLTVLLLAAMEFGMIRSGEKIEKTKQIIDTSGEINSSGARIGVERDQLRVAEDDSNGGAVNGVLPKKIKIDVPFTSQAPFANWDPYHEEACEEASLIMVKYYLDGKKLDPDTAEREILAMIDYEIKNLGKYEDTTAEQNVEIFNGFFGTLPGGKKLKVIYDFTAWDLKKYLAQGNPIIVPAAGRELGNPNFSGAGPLYHNLVLVGYDGNTIITNDPGTRKGEGYKYNIQVLYSAIHDFPGRPEDIDSGRKAMIVLE
jgi:VanZ family protein